MAKFYLAALAYRRNLGVSVASAALLALTAGPVFAQGARAPQADPPPPKSQTQIDGERAAERAYNNSLGNIPDKAAADPWGGARSLDAPKAAEKPAAAKAVKKKPPV
jgi:hypothetical protein